MTPEELAQIKPEDGIVIKKRGQDETEVWIVTAITKYQIIVRFRKMYALRFNRDDGYLRGEQGWNRKFIIRMATPEETDKAKELLAQRNKAATEYERENKSAEVTRANIANFLGISADLVEVNRHGRAENGTGTWSVIIRKMPEPEVIRIFHPTADRRMP